MLILALADRPKPQSYAIVPFIVRADGRNLVCGHPERELDDERLRGLLANPIGALDVSALDARVDACEAGLMACWLGGVFEATRLLLGVPTPEFSPHAHVLGGQGRFWIAPAHLLHGARHRWLMRAARLALRRNDHEIAKLMRWADPFAFVTHAVSWQTCPTETGKIWELAWSAATVFPDRGRLSKRKLEKGFRRLVADLRKDAAPV